MDIKRHVQSYLAMINLINYLITTQTQPVFQGGPSMSQKEEFQLIDLGASHSQEGYGRAPWKGLWRPSDQSLGALGSIIDSCFALVLADFEW